MYFEGELPAVTYGNCNNANNGFTDWTWIVALALIGGLFGNGGFGFGGGNRGFCGTPATQADLSAGFNNSAVLSNLNDIILGQAQMQNFTNQGFAGLNTAISAATANLDNAVCTLGYNIQGGFNDISHQISDCCCATQRAIDSVNYNMATNTCNIIASQNAQTQRLLDFMVGEKLSAKDAQIATLQAQISNDRQTRTIVNELRDGCPIPAYITCNPNAPYPYPYGFGGCCGASVQ